MTDLNSYFVLCFDCDMDVLGLRSLCFLIFPFIFDPCPAGWFFISKDTDNRQESLIYLPEQSSGSFQPCFPGRPGW